MNASIITFLVWAALMVAMVIGLALASRRGRTRAQETEDVASEALPAIGRAAERTHSVRFGRAPTDVPGQSREKNSSWYPPTKTRAGKPG
jgi:hypothetical protein